MSKEVDYKKIVDIPSKRSDSYFDSDEEDILFDAYMMLRKVGMSEENIEEENPIMASALEKSFEYVGGIRGQSSTEEDFEADNVFEKITVYSMVFGMNLERENPRVYIVFDENGVVRASVSHPDNLDVNEEGVEIRHIRNM